MLAGYLLKAEGPTQLGNGTAARRSAMDHHCAALGRPRLRGKVVRETIHCAVRVVLDFKTFIL